MADSWIRVKRKEIVIIVPKYFQYEELTHFIKKEGGNG